MPEVNPLIRIENEGYTAHGIAYVIEDAHTFEDILRHMILNEIDGPPERAREELMAILKTMSL